LKEQNKHITKLLEACKRKEQSAQFEIYKLYYKAMFNTALRITKDSFEAEDVMQEAFLNAFTKLDTYKGEVAFGAWLKRIVINMSLTQIKKNSRFEEVKFNILENVIEDKVSAEVDETINYSEIKAKEILNTMEQLKDNYRVALTLSLIEGYDNDEVAMIMEISKENSRTTISRAKGKLRRILSQNTLIN
jgi:RNA polymerase sigma-70 factor (ECF subfamily)